MDDSIDAVIVLAKALVILLSLAILIRSLPDDEAY